MTIGNQTSHVIRYSERKLILYMRKLSNQSSCRDHVPPVLFPFTSFAILLSLKANAQRKYSVKSTFSVKGRWLPHPHLELEYCSSCYYCIFQLLILSLRCWKKGDRINNPYKQYTLHCYKTTLLSEHVTNLFFNFTTNLKYCTRIKMEDEERNLNRLQEKDLLMINFWSHSPWTSYSVNLHEKIL